MIGWPALLLVDYERSGVTRYERFAPNGVRRTHFLPARGTPLRDLEFSVWESEELRRNGMGTEFMIGGPFDDSPKAA